MQCEPWEGGVGAMNESVLAGPGYTTLSGLDLSYNLLTSLSPTAFSRLRYLESLDLSHNGLAALPAESFTSSPLSDVNLSHNRLREVSVKPDPSVLSVASLAWPGGCGAALHFALVTTGGQRLCQSYLVCLGMQ